MYREFGPTHNDQHPAWFQGVDGISKENCSIFKLKKKKTTYLPQKWRNPIESITSYQINTFSQLIWLHETFQFVKVFQCHALKKKKLHSGRKKSNLSLTHTHFLYKTVVWSFMCTSSENWIPSVCNQVNSLRQVQTCFNNRLYYHTHMIQSHKKETIHSQW